ncbi:hypothetical protein B9Z55_027098 [Caenorhabditis nigoni]|uniref:Uncharacterized protein n=1 Tax=Caenorhabditis nigoni TaxID=1611254 RepID=A0A2G5SJC6_9PELO|nr:hypothetical protein B9Z55_027098 [Caenorhabditis nigoni]
MQFSRRLGHFQPSYDHFAYTKFSKFSIFAEIGHVWAHFDRLDELNLKMLEFLRKMPIFDLQTGKCIGMPNNRGSMVFEFNEKSGRVNVHDTSDFYGRTMKEETEFFKVRFREL